MISTLAPILVLVVTFVLSYLVTKRWIHLAWKFKLVGKDMNKYKRPKVAEAGGFSVVIAIAIGILLYIAIKTFIFNSAMHLVETFALLATIMFSGFLGFVDDILGWKHGLKQWQKPVFTIPAALPLAVISAGVSVMCIPFLGCYNFGILYPILIVPSVVIIAANGFNMLAGYNGLEASQGVVILSFLGAIFYIIGRPWLTLIALIGIVALLAFLRFNWFPAKVFPGDSLTYGVGAFIGALVILGNAEKAFAILFIPYILDFILTARSKFKAEAFAKINPDDSLEVPYNKFYDTTHIAIWLLKRIKKKVYEKDVVITVILFQIVCGIASLLVVL